MLINKHISLSFLMYILDYYMLSKIKISNHTKWYTNMDGKILPSIFHLLHNKKTFMSFEVPTKS